MSSYIVTVSHDVLTQIMALVPDDADWARLLGTGCHDLKQRLLAIKPKQLNVSLNKSSVNLLQQMAIFRQHNPRLDTWPQHVQLVLTQQSSSTAFMVLWMPLVAHCQKATATTILKPSELDPTIEDEPDLPFFGYEYTRAAWHSQSQTTTTHDKRCQKSLIHKPSKKTHNVTYPVTIYRHDTEMIRHLPLLDESKRAYLRECLQQTVVLVNYMSIDITTDFYAPTLTKLSIKLPSGWETSLMNAWQHVICHAPCLQSVYVEFEIVADVTEYFSLPWIKSPYLETFVINAPWHQLDFELPAIPSLRHLTVKGSPLYFTPPDEPFELKSLCVADNNRRTISRLDEYCDLAILEELKIQSPFQQSYETLLQSLPLITDLHLNVNTGLHFITCFPKTLTRLALSERNQNMVILTYPKDLTPLIEPLFCLKSLMLKNLRIAQPCEIQNEECVRYLDLSRLPKSITSLDLSLNSSIKPELLLARLDKSLPNLTRLDMTDCYSLGSPMPDWMYTLPATLQHFDVSNCGISLSSLREYPPQLQTLVLGKYNHWELKSTNSDTVLYLDTEFIELLPMSIRRVCLPPIRVKTPILPTIVTRSTNVLKGLMDMGVIQPPRIRVVYDSGVFVRRVVGFDEYGMVPYAGQLWHVDQLKLGEPSDEFIEDDE